MINCANLHLFGAFVPWWLNSLPAHAPDCTLRLYEKSDFLLTLPLLFFSLFRFSRKHKFCIRNIFIYGYFFKNTRSFLKNGKK